MSEPDVSVIVPALNEEERIPTCLEYLNRQDFTGSYEVIVADGCSEDRTVEIAEEMGARVVREKHRRIAAERQAGAKVARGRLLLFTDADSTAPPEWISSVVRSFETHPRVACVYGPVMPSDSQRSTTLLAEIVIPAYMILSGMIGFYTPIGSNMAFRREAFEEIGGFNADLVTCEDLDIAMRSRQCGRLLLDTRMRMYASQRRVDAWGLLHYTVFGIGNAIRYRLTGTSSSSYEDIR
jgi:cellulose synthase/poly-beta-1,6-N-acetylglucosamine synthase-like glycosyltransferase